jgi:gas vesicle protein
MSQQPIPPTQQKESGSFLTGFTLGLLAGAVGHFLFTTDRGEKVRKSLMEEWKIAKKEIEKAKTKSTVENIEEATEKMKEASVSLRDMAKKAANYVVTKVEELDDEGPKKTKKKSSEKKTTAKKSATKKKTFSGV